METFYSAERNVLILIALLKAHGIKKIIASPGTTNITFVASVQSDPYFEIYSSVDERSAAYIACGMAAESGEPVVLSCTGATASRNYFPGLTEAFYRKLPILAVTSSQHSGRMYLHSPQITDRTQPPRDVVKKSLQLPTLHTPEDLNLYSIKINEALTELTRAGGGPVHINLITGYGADFNVKTLPNVQPINRIEYGDSFPKIPVDKRIAILVGTHPRWSNELREAVDDFCECYNAAVFCDPSSNYDGRHRIFFSLISSQAQIFSVQRPDILIYIGDIAGTYFALAANEFWRVGPDGEFRAPYGSLRYVFDMRESTFFQKYVGMAERKRSTSFYDECRMIFDRLSNAVPELPFSNAWIAQRTASRLPEGSVLHLGILNSLRTWSFFELPRGVRAYANTGGYGIDGCVSSLIGASLAAPEKIFFGVVGDLAFFYDMNSIGNRHVDSNIRLMLVNNGKGAEFKLYNHFAARFKDDVEPFIAGAGHWGNRSRALVRHYAEDLDFEYMSAENKDEYLRNLDRFLTPERLERPILFEVFTDSKDESDALFLIQHIESQRNALNFPKPRIFCGNRSLADQLCKALGIERKDFFELDNEQNVIMLERVIDLFRQNRFPIFFTPVYDQLKAELERRGLKEDQNFMDGRKFKPSIKFVTPPPTAPPIEAPSKQNELDRPQLGFGVMRLPFIDNNRLDGEQILKMFDEYMKGDFRYFDTHPAYVHGISQRIIKQFVVDRYPRESFLLADKIPYTVRRAEDYPSIFESSLRECGVEYFDYYLLHCLTESNYRLHQRLGGFEFLARLKREGRVKHIGFSFHDKPELLERILTEHPEVEFVQLQINYLDWEDPIIQSRRLYETARKFEKKIFVMEPIKGGSLANLTDLDVGFDADLKTFAELALKFVAALDVDIILSGMSAVEHVINNRKTLEKKIAFADLDAKKYDLMREAIMRAHKIPCTACRYCERECPKKIAIPDIISLLNACDRVGLHDRTYLGRFKIFYDRYVFERGKAGDCIQCGACEARCPQKISIRQHMLAAKKMFEG